MAPQKRNRDEAEGGSSAPSHAKKPRRGFNVGPQNVPEGPWKRKIDKKKAQLIEKAKVKKAYSKIRERELGSKLARKPRARAEPSGKPKDAKKQQEDDAGADEEQKDDAVAASEAESSDDEDEGDLDVNWDEPAQASEQKAAPTNPTQTAAAPAAAASQPTAEEDEIHPDRQAMLENGGELENPNEIEVRRRPNIGTSTEGDAAKPDGHGRGTGDRFDAAMARRSRSRNKPDYFAKQLAQAEKRKAEAEERTREAERRRKEREGKVAERELYRKRVAKARREDKNGRRKLGRESGLLLDKVKRMVGQS